MLVAAALIPVIPFLLTPIPPLTDVQGHIGRMAVQVAPPGDPLGRFFAFHWALVPNLASDLLVELGHRWVGLFGAMWLIAAATAGLTSLAVVLLARVAGIRAAHSLPWALLYVFNFPFFWGFINYAFATALAMLALAGWIGLTRRPALRAVLALVVVPVVFVGHAVSGLLLVATIVGVEVWPPRGIARRLPDIARAIWAPLLALVAILIVWRLIAPSGGGQTVWLPYRKLEAAVMVLRDQNIALDIGSLVASIVVALLGWRWGARFRGGTAGPVVAASLMFLFTPSLISGSDRIDTRLAPAIPLLGFALLDWGAVGRARRRAVALAGLALLSARFVVTAVSFAAYGQRFAAELAALRHVRPGARVLNLTRVDCGIAGWRASRLEHLANLATPLRGAWVNAHWSIGGVQLLTVRYRPSPDYVADPSQLIWPDHCIDRRQPFAARDRHDLAETMPHLPLARVDYLWIIGERLPAPDPRLRQVWAAGDSALYATASTEALDTAARLGKRSPSGGAAKVLGRVAQR